MFAVLYRRKDVVPPMDFEWHEFCSFIYDTLDDAMRHAETYHIEALGVPNHLDSKVFELRPVH